MTEFRPEDRRPIDGIASDLDQDLRAFRDATARDLPPLSHRLSSIRSRRPRVALTWKERFMSPAETVRTRPWLAGGVITAVLALAMLVIPVSYLRTTGHAVALTLPGVEDLAQARGIAGQLQSLLRVSDVTVSAPDAHAGWTLAASVPAGNGVDADAMAQAFARGLTARGLSARAVTTAVRERVSGTVYAYAKDLVVRVETDGKTAAQIEAEVSQRLSDAGVHGAHVSVTDAGAEQRKVTLEVQGGAQAQGPSSVTVQLAKDGRTTSAGGASVQIRKTMSASGVSLHVDVTDAGKSASFDVANVDRMSDAALRSAIEERLKRAGLDCQATVTKGEVEIRHRQ